MVNSHSMDSLALDKISVQGFKSIASIKDLDLGRMNILIGSNGSGKSNFIGVFSFLHAIREGRLRDTVTAAGGAERLLHFGSKITHAMSFHLSFSGGINEYRLKLLPTADDGLFPSSETAHYWEPSNHATPMRHDLAARENGREAGISHPYLSGIPGWVRARLEGWRLYHLHDTSFLSPMRKTARVDDNGFLRTDGANLAPFLLQLKELHPISYDLIRRTVQQVAPFFDDFDLKPLQRKPDDIKLEWRHRGSDQYFDASSLSDGTLRFIALATLFLQPSKFKPSAILIDEPELGLHPYAIGLLASLIRSASVETQVIVSTQSSLLLDHFDPEDVLVADRVENSTQISRLEPDRLADWLKEYSLGQLWEKNEFGGRPNG